MTRSATLARAMTRERAAKTAHAAAVAEIRVLLARLDAAAFEEQARLTSPTWTEAETAQRFAAQLREVSDQMLGEGEYADASD